MASPESPNETHVSSKNDDDEEEKANINAEDGIAKARSIEERHQGTSGEEVQNHMENNEASKAEPSEEVKRVLSWNVLEDVNTDGTGVTKTGSKTGSLIVPDDEEEVTSILSRRGTPLLSTPLGPGRSISDQAVKLPSIGESKVAHTGTDKDDEDDKVIPPKDVLTHGAKMMISKYFNSDETDMRVLAFTPSFEETMSQEEDEARRRSFSKYSSRRSSPFASPSGSIHSPLSNRSSFMSAASRVLESVAEVDGESNADQDLDVNDDGQYPEYGMDADQFRAESDAARTPVAQIEGVSPYLQLTAFHVIQFAMVLCIWLFISFVATILHGGVYEDEDCNSMTKWLLLIVTFPEMVVCVAVGCPVNCILSAVTFFCNTLSSLACHPLGIAVVVMPVLSLLSTSLSRNLLVYKLLTSWLLISFVTETMHDSFEEDCEDDDCSSMTRNLYQTLKLPETVSCFVIGGAAQGMVSAATLVANTITSLACHPLGTIALIMTAVYSYLMLEGDVRCV